MSALRDALENYLAVRRRLGADLSSSAYELRRFVTFLEGEDATHMTTELALRWCSGRSTYTPPWRASASGW